jgi:tetratricopeptide (TPR) repeat protein
MPEDLRGVPVSALSATALEATDDFNRRLLRLDAGMDRLLRAREDEPDDPLLNLYAALIYLYGQHTESFAQAGTLLDLVENHPSQLSPRDARLLEAVRAFQGRRFYEAQELLEALTVAYPRDLLAAKFCEFAYYALGQQESGPRFRAHMDRLERANEGDPDFLGMQAFAYELCGQLKEAEVLAREAIEAEPRNPWAEHALSHALIREGDIETGIREMEAFLPQLKTCDRLIQCHDGWHLALLHLERLDEASTRRVFSETVWPFNPDAVGEQIDAISLGWRMDMAGFEMDGFWEEVAAHAAPRAGDVIIPFLSAHYAYAFSRAGNDDALAELIEAAGRRAGEHDPEARQVWAPVGRNLVEAGAACGQGFYREAAELMRPVIEQVACVGGSDAQDDLFRLAYAHALGQSGHHGEAAAFREFWQPTRNPTPLDDQLFSN